jgi:Flp pilus assembly secretin CpaC
MARVAPVKHAFVRVLVAACLLTGTLGAPAVAQEDMIRVSMDHARIIKLDREISKVIVGSSAVADVAVADANTIVLTGKSYGTTNLVILDPDGQAIVDETVLVSVDEANTLRIYRQTERSVFSCAPACEEHVKTAITAAP